MRKCLLAAAFAFIALAAKPSSADQCDWNDPTTAFIVRKPEDRRTPALGGLEEARPDPSRRHAVRPEPCAPAYMCGNPRTGDSLPLVADGLRRGTAVYMLRPVTRPTTLDKMPPAKYVPLAPKRDGKEKSGA